jgi:hypothetical protein
MDDNRWQAAPGKFFVATSTSAVGRKRTNYRGLKSTFVRFDLPAQPVDATQALNLSAGVSNCKVFRGRSLS